MTRRAISLMLFVAACGGGSSSPDAKIAADASAVDASAVDAAPGTPDAQDLADAPAADAPVADASPADASPADASPADASPADATTTDAQVADASPADAVPADAVPADAVPAPDATSPDAAPAPDAMIVLGNGDTCATANNVSAQAASAAGFTFSGDTTGLGNEIQPVSSCTGYVNDGPDAVFIVTASAGQTITASITSTGWDGAVEIIPTCTFAATCLAGADDVGADETETATATVTTAGTYYVIADSWDAGDYGPYELTIKVQ